MSKKHLIVDEIFTSINYHPCLDESLRSINIHVWNHNIPHNKALLYIYDMRSELFLVNSEVFKNPSVFLLTCQPGCCRSKLYSSR